MKAQELKAWLKSERVPTEVINYFLGEDVGDDFDLDAKTAEWNSSKEDVIKAKIEKSGGNDEAIKAAKKAAGEAAIGTMIKHVMKITGAKKEDLQGLSTGQLLDKVNAYHIENQEGEIDERVEKAMSQLDKYKNEAISWQEKYTELEETMETSVAERMKEKNNEVKSFKKTRLLDELIFDPKQIEFDERGPSFYKDLIMLKAQKLGYKFDVDDKDNLIITADDGTTPITMDGKGIYKEPIEFIRDLANKEKYIKRSKGGKGTDVYGKIGGGKSLEGDDQKEVDVSGLDDLRSQLGIQ